MSEPTSNSSDNYIIGDAAEARHALAIAATIGGAVGLAALLTVLSVWSYAGGT